MLIQILHRQAHDSPARAHSFCTNDGVAVLLDRLAVAVLTYLSTMLGPRLDQRSITHRSKIEFKNRSGKFLDRFLVDAEIKFDATLKHINEKIDGEMHRKAETQKEETATPETRHQAG